MYRRTTANETAGLVEEIVERQQPDGGFRPQKSLPWRPKDTTDGYITSFATFVLKIRTRSS